MAIYAELHDGTRLEFPDETDPAVIQRVVKSQIESAKKSIQVSPTDGMTTGDKLLAGIGKGFVDTGRGVKQLLNIGDQDQLRRDIEESRRLDKPLMDTGAGIAGNVVGNIAATAPALFIPGANTIAGGSAIGAGMGAVTPSLSDEEALANSALGGAGGAVGVAAGRVLPTAFNAFVAPFTQKGRDKIAGNVLREAVGEDVAGTVARLKNPEIFVPGSTPNMAEATLNPKIAALLKAVRNLPEGREAIVGQEIKNNQARLDAIRGIAQDDAAIEAAKAARNSVASPFYESAGQQTAQGDDVIREILNRPSAQHASVRAARLAKEKGETFKIGTDAPEQVIDTGLLDAKGNPITKVIPAENQTYTGKGLHYLKMGIDDLLDRPTEAGIGNHEIGAIQGTKSDFLNWLEQAIPDYKSARTAYAEASKPINQMEVGQALKNKLTPALTESGLPTRERANMFAEAIRNQQATIKKATGQRNATLEDVMTPEQMKTIVGISKDLERKANASDLAAARGSDTAQNLIADNMLRNIVGPIGMPQSWASKAVGSAIVNALPRRAVDLAIPSVERKVQGLLADAMTDPALAAKLLEKTDKRSKIAEILYRSAMGLGAQGALNAN